MRTYAEQGSHYDKRLVVWENLNRSHSPSNALSRDITRKHSINVSSLLKTRPTDMFDLALLSFENRSIGYLPSGLRLGYDADQQMSVSSLGPNRPFPRTAGSKDVKTGEVPLLTQNCNW